MDDHEHDHDQQVQATAGAQDLARLERKVDTLIELMCPRCAPAALVRLHPDMGPTPVRPPLREAGDTDHRPD